MSQRYAIYYVPHAGSALARFGASLLGYDVETGLDVEPLDHPLFHDPASLGWTAAPRRYGFHATLKAPFHLAEGRSSGELAEALVAFTRAQRPLEVTLTLAPYGRFLALVPVEPVAAADALAAACVRVFDLFRAPLTPEDRERRHPEQLIAEQVALLDEWGYPFVLSQFQFHMTLTGVLEPEERARLEPVLRDMLAAVPLTTRIDGLTLCRQDGRNDRFVVERRYAFGG